MKKKGKIVAVGLLASAFVLAIGYGAARETAVAESSERPGQETVSFSDPADAQRKREVFEERFAKRKAEFEKEYNEVRQQNERIRQKFNNCREPSEEELRAAIARELKKRGRI